MFDYDKSVDEMANLPFLPACLYFNFSTVPIIHLPGDDQVSSILVFSLKRLLTPPLLYYLRLNGTISRFQRLMVFDFGK